MATFTASVEARFAPPASFSMKTSTCRRWRATEKSAMLSVRYRDAGASCGTFFRSAVLTAKRTRYAAFVAAAKGVAEIFRVIRRCAGTFRIRFHSTECTGCNTRLSLICCNLTVLLHALICGCTCHASSFFSLANKKTQRYASFIVRGRQRLSVLQQLHNPSW